jgi:hypothetical protein
MNQMWHRARLSAPLCMALLAGCIFAQEEVRPQVGGDDLDMGSRLDLGGAGEEQGGACPELACIARCEGQALIECVEGADGCLAERSTTCEAAQYCDEGALKCEPNPCIQGATRACDPQDSSRVFECGEVGGRSQPTQTRRCDAAQVCDVSAETGCAASECTSDMLFECVDEMTALHCIQSPDADRYILATESCVFIGACEGGECVGHECSEDELNTTRCVEGLNAEQTCRENERGRRVWETRPCGEGEGCSMSEQRCRVHECSEEELTKVTYCTEDKRLARCIPDGLRRVRTDVRACARAQKCEQMPGTMPDQCVCDHECVTDAVLCNRNSTRYQTCTVDPTTQCRIFGAQTSCPPVDMNIGRPWHEIGCRINAENQRREQLVCYTQSTGHCGFRWPTPECGGL